MNEKLVLKFGDYAVILSYLIFSVSIGICFRLKTKGKNTAKVYFLGKGEMNIYVVALSLMVSLFSSITLIGVPSDVYRHGIKFIFYNVGTLLSTPVMAYLFLPVLFHKDRLNLYEYLQHRFGKFLRSCVSLLFVIQTVIYLSVVLYTSALALATVSHLGLEASAVLLGVTCTVYSTLGGISGLLLTDTIQSILIYASVFAIFIKGCMLKGGIAGVWNTARKGDRLNFPSFSPDPTIRYSFLSLTLGGCVHNLTCYAANQTQVQRLVTAGSLWVQWVVTTVLSGMVCSCGIILYAYYADCDPVHRGAITKIDQILPLFVMETMSHIPGLVGFFFSGLFSAGLTTFSAGLYSVSAVMYKDFVISRLDKFHLTDRLQSVICHCLVFFVGIILTGLAVLIQHLGGVLKISQTLIGAVGGPILGVFILGLFFPSSNQLGTTAAMLVSFITCLWIGYNGASYEEAMLLRRTDGCNDTIFASSMNSSMENYLRQINSTTIYSERNGSIISVVYSVSSLWYSALAAVITIVISLPVSFITKKYSIPLDAELLSPILARFCHKNRDGIMLKMTAVTDST